MIKYVRECVKEYDFIMTTDTPMGSHRIFINLNGVPGKTIESLKFLTQKVIKHD